MNLGLSLMVFKLLILNMNYQNDRLNQSEKNNQCMVHFVRGLSNSMQTKCTTTHFRIQALGARWLILNKKIYYAVLAQVLQIIAK